MFYNRSENEPSPDLHSLKMISRTDPVIPKLTFFIILFITKGHVMLPAAWKLPVA